MFQRCLLPPSSGWWVSRVHLWNVGTLLLDYTAQQTRREPSSYSPPWEPESSQNYLPRRGYYTTKITTPINPSGFDSGEDGFCSSDTKHDRRTAPRTACFFRRENRGHYPETTVERSSPGEDCSCSSEPKNDKRIEPGTKLFVLAGDSRNEFHNAEELSWVQAQVRMVSVARKLSTIEQHREQTCLLGRDDYTNKGNNPEKLSWVSSPGESGFYSSKTKHDIWMALRLKLFVSVWRLENRGQNTEKLSRFRVPVNIVSEARKISTIEEQRQDQSCLFLREVTGSKVTTP
jgi:hypothetical protein